VLEGIEGGGGGEGYEEVRMARFSIQVGVGNWMRGRIFGRGVREMSEDGCA
jgi:hypothetical protein